MHIMQEKKIFFCLPEENFVQFSLCGHTANLLPHGYHFASLSICEDILFCFRTKETIVNCSKSDKFAFLPPQSWINLSCAQKWE